MTNIDIEKLLLCKYGINVKSVEKSDESTDGNVYIVSGAGSSDDKCVVKIYEDISHAETMVKLHTYINEYGLGLTAPKIILNEEKSGITTISEAKNRKEEYLVCYSFAEGNKLRNMELTNEKITAIATYLQKLHSIKQNEFGLENVPFEITASRQSVLHFDITKHNIFCGEKGICFIDFDDAKFGPSVCDVAIALTNLFISKATGANVDGMKLFIDSYYSSYDDATKQAELPLIKNAALCWLNSIIENQNFDTSTREGLENKIKIWGRTQFLKFTFYNVFFNSCQLWHDNFQ